MTKLISLLISVSFICACAFAPLPSQAQASYSLAITHANLIDGVSAAPISDATVLIRDGRIESVVTGKAELPSGATVLDLKGRWLLPGFVDAHAHLADLGAARRALASGATTVRCIGVDKRTGSIKPGMEGDFIAIERDPTANTSAIQDVIIVINNGKIAVNRLGW